MTDSKPVIDFIFRITNEVLWNTFKKNEIGDVMLPFVVLRRMDCRLAEKKENVRNTYLNFKDKVNPDKLDPILRKAAGDLQFYNTSKYDLKGLTQEPQNIEINFSNYINGFNQDVRDIMEYFQLDKIIARLVKNNLLFQMVEGISNVDLSLENIDNHNMGYVFEELIRISNEQSNETAGEHFTPRDVINLMIRILFSTEKQTLNQPGIIRALYDPTCGTGGMLTLSKKYVLEEINPKAVIKIFGQEINEQSFAIAKSDLLITGEDANNIKHGNSFSDDKFQSRRFNYMMANPPYGVSWKRDENYIKNESLNPAGRFYAGLPRSSDGQLLFLQHMISKMEPNGTRIAVVTNGSPLFTGDAGSGESEIRKWIITNDWLDCIVALPKDMFYNTGIYTYIWFITNKKEAHRKGKIQLINAVDFCLPEKKSLGNKRNKLYENHLDEIEKIYTAFGENDNSKIFANEYFGYYQVTIERPLLDKNGVEITDRDNRIKPDPKFRDTENIPLSEDVMDYYWKEIIPNAGPEVWIDYDKTRIGYEINFTRYFYKYQKPEPSATIKAEIITLENSIQDLLKKVLI